jgi:hypothetical protein
MIVTDRLDTSLTIADDRRNIGAECAAAPAYTRAPPQAQHRRRLFGRAYLATHDLMSYYACANWMTLLIQR